MQKSLIDGSKYKTKKRDKKFGKINILQFKNINFNYPGEKNRY